MIYHCYAMRDRILDIWRQPGFDQTSPDDVAEAYRRLIQSPNTPLDRVSMLKGHAIYHIGDFDDLTGSLTVFKDPEFIADLTDYFPVEDKKDGSKGD